MPIAAYHHSEKRGKYFLLLIALLCGVGIPMYAVAMDQVRIETGTDAAVTKYNLSGAGVTVAILDRGIDWSHPDFRKPDGTTRIKWLLDMTGQLYCPGSPAPIEYSEADINAALIGGPTVPSRDAVGHGTVTAALAAGDGSASPGGKYRGMAPQADLIIVKLTAEYSAPHGDQPEELGFHGCTDDALFWLDEKINLLGQPCVATINSGVQWGPMDGTSAPSTVIDELFGDRPGRIYVSPSGDEGNLPTHAKGTYTNSADTVVNLNAFSADFSYLSIWYTGSQPAQITITFEDGTSVGPVPPGGALSQFGISIYQYFSIGAFYPWTSENGDRAVAMSFSGHTGPGTMRIRGTTSGTGTFDFYHAIPQRVTFLDHLVPGRLTDYSTTFSAIVAGCHVIGNNWTDIHGAQWSETNTGLVDELWYHSSGGPTRDGRDHGVDVTAPGHGAFGAYAPNSVWATSEFNLIHDGGGLYGRHGATSASGPIVTGAVALLLELNPNLTDDDVRQILRDTARSDAYTGTTPSLDWGYGKLDVLAAADRVNELCAGDFDCSGTIDAFDINTFVSVLLGQDTNPRHIARADVDGNDLANGRDVGPFVDLIFP